jgi:hypothetical protein
LDDGRGDELLDLLLPTTPARPRPKGADRQSRTRHVQSAGGLAGDRVVLVYFLAPAAGGT